MFDVYVVLCFDVYVVCLMFMFDVYVWCLCCFCCFDVYVVWCLCLLFCLMFMLFMLFVILMFMLFWCLCCFDVYVLLLFCLMFCCCFVWCVCCCPLPRRRSPLLPPLRTSNLMCESEGSPLAPQEGGGAEDQGRPWGGQGGSQASLGMVLRLSWDPPGPPKSC